MPEQLTRNPKNQQGIYFMIGAPVFESYFTPPRAENPFAKTCFTSVATESPSLARTCARGIQTKVQSS